ncbi:hypothetical protein CFOUR_02795 [Corynebacterium fournieri]|nr:hypothetical protein CFOUR_02795 [Corynebacterium fournieri]
MTTVSPKKGHDPSRVNAISEKLIDSPELAKLIGELSTSTDDASELVKGAFAGIDQRRPAGGDGCPFGL